MRCCSLLTNTRQAALQGAAALLIVLSLVASHPAPIVSATALAQSSTTAPPATEPSSLWAKTKKETSLWSGWDEKALDFGKVAAEITVQVIEVHGSRAYVYFPGDSKGHKAGEVWIDKADLQDLPWPRWARARRFTSLRTEPSLASDEVQSLTRGQYVETIGDLQGRWAKVFFLTDRQPGEWVVGWVDGMDLMLPRGDQTTMSDYMLTRARLLAGSPELWLKVPYRSQLDGSPFAAANCGPTSVAMALEAVGKSETLQGLRVSALQLQGLNGNCDDCGTFIGHLAKIAEARGASTYSLFDEGDAFHAWTLDDVRAQLKQQRVVIPQVRFNLLPGRTKSGYGGDHYVVIVGLSGQDFIYNDPVDSDGRGYGRLITASQLEAAMKGAHGEFSRAAFAVGKGPTTAAIGP